MKKASFSASPLYLCLLFLASGFFILLSAAPRSKPLSAVQTKAAPDSLTSPQDSLKNRPFFLKEIKTDQESRDVRLILAFNAGTPEFKTVKSVETEWTLLTFELANTQAGDVRLPVINVPLSHLELTSSVLWDSPLVKLHIYFRNLPPYRISQTADEIQISFPQKALLSDTGKAVLLDADYRNLDETTFLMKFEFDHLPEKRAVFLAGEQNIAVISFYNTRLENSIHKPPNIPNLTGFQYIHGEFPGGIPYVRIVYEFSCRLEHLVREDPGRFFVDLIQKEPVTSPVVSVAAHLPVPAPAPASAPVSAVAPDSAPAVSPGSYTASAPESENKVKKGSGMKWTYLSLASGIIIGGAVTAALVLKGDKGSEGTDAPADSKVNGIETEITLPGPPE